ncbi:mannan endo-1,4-beta-mannosidase-like [Mya arenaria]|uniref:mannan endo-1,4-beta-mannosidase-like n=1 Tax=Mya arenaria TaxID=6604 RepID=UPI0022E2EFE2|nr:mannan endo-1,4-beta-mannosidase-like [Mya arenaria]
MKYAKRMYYVITALVVFDSCYAREHTEAYLSVSGRNLTFRGEKVFLSGVNQAWYQYGNDFGNNAYAGSRPHLLHTLDAVHANGGNSLRIWLHVEGFNTPQFNSSGHVVGPGANVTRDLRDFLLEARRRNILVTISLWNCAAIKKELPLYRMLTNVTVLQSYLDNALTPLVQALGSEVSLAVWEVMNEPEGCMAVGIEDKKEPCYDTTSLHIWDFADWTGLSIPLSSILPFIARHAATIHRHDPKALVTVGSWTYKSVTPELGRRNLYSDACLRYAADGDPGARLDVYQIHTYSALPMFLPHDPFVVNASMYGLDKPLIIGEFSQKKGGLKTSQELFTWAYYNGYNGAWSWSALDSDDASDSLEVQERGLRSLKNKDDPSHGGKINITLCDVTSCTSYTHLWLCSFLEIIHAFYKDVVAFFGTRMVTVNV